MSRCSGNCWKVSKKTPWVESFLYKRLKFDFNSDFDFVLIRRDLVVETFRNKFSYLYHFIITPIHKFL